MSQSKIKREFLCISFLLISFLHFHICHIFHLVARYLKRLIHSCSVKELFLFILGLNALSSSKFISPVDLESSVHLSVLAFENEVAKVDFILHPLVQVGYTYQTVFMLKKLTLLFSHVALIDNISLV